MSDKENKTSKKIFFLIISILIATSIVFLLIGLIFGPSFAIKYSPDGVLRESTLSKIYLMKEALLLGSFLVLAFILALLFRYDKSLAFIRKRKKVIVNLIVLLFTIALFFLLSELILWIMLRNETSFSSSGPGSLKFNKEFVKINSQGFRDMEFSVLKRAGTRRIAVVGDSISFGSGIRNINDAYPKLFEGYLNNGSKKYEVYNFGIPGYDADDELETIKNKVVNYKPDIIIIEYYENDLENVDPELQSTENIENWQIPVAGFWLREISYTYYFFESRFNRAAENIGIKKKWLDTLNTTYNSETNREYNLKVYGNISKIAKENNATVILVIFPVISDFKNYQFQIVHEFAKEIAQKNNFYFVDLLDEFKKYPADRLVVNKYDYHPNELGHQVAAEKILESFINQSILK